MTLLEAIQSALDAYSGPITEDETREAVKAIWAAYRARKGASQGNLGARVRLQRRVLSAMRPKEPILRTILAAKLAGQDGRPAVLPGEFDAALHSLIQAGAVVAEGDLLVRI